MAAVDIRVPVGRPLILTGTAPVGDKWHPLGPGVKRRKAYPSSALGPLKLPASGPALEQLADTITEPIPGVPASLTRECWTTLLSDAPLIADAPLGEEEIVELLGAGVDGRVRRLVLGAVFQMPNETLADGALSSARLGVVATLTVHLDEGGQPLNAWLSAEWVHSTRGMLAALHKIPGLRTSEHADGYPITVLLAEDHHLVDTTLAESIRRTGDMSGVRVTVHEMNGSLFGNIDQIIKRKLPSQLVIAGSRLPSTLGDNFADLRGPNRVHHLQAETPAELIENLREQLPFFAGVGSALTSIVTDSRTDTVPAMPLTSAAACIHVGRVVYVRDSVTDLWWTRDHTGHADVVFKTYRLSDQKLIWANDHTADGTEYVGKNKGEGTREVSVVARGSCGYLQRHI
jgi:hypothetical protein